MEEPEVHPLEAFRRVNVDGTLRLARQAAEAGVHRFVFVSSIGEGERGGYADVATFP
jgi:nucleoside-diphosphate-sugar epimerase